MTEASQPAWRPEVAAWIEAEAAEQAVRYRKIVEEMDALAQTREQWIEEFFQRIQTRGYNVHADILRLIRPEELPARPDRPLRVVY